MINVTKTKLPSINQYSKYLKKIWHNNWVTNNGEFVQSLEKKLQNHLRVKNLLVVSNGTLALQLALKVLNLRGEVITTPFTFPATTNVILWEKLKPVFADIDAKTFNIAPQDIEKKITAKTSAILAVHVYGSCCDVERIQKIASRHNLKIIYDAAHSFGVEHNNKSILDSGDISIMSFHATKTFNTIEGGAIITKNNKLFEKLKLLRNFGIQSEEKVVLPGINAKMNEFQAAMGLCNLKNIKQETKHRKKIWECYKKELQDCNNITFQELNAFNYHYGYMPVCFANRKQRDIVYSELIKNGIKSRKYFYPLTTSSEYLRETGMNLEKKHNLIIASNVADRILCLPIYPELKIAIVHRIVKIIKKHTDVKPKININHHNCLSA